MKFLSQSIAINHLPMGLDDNTNNISFMDPNELTALLHELIDEQNKCDSQLFFEKTTNFDKRDNVMKKILDLNKTN